MTFFRSHLKSLTKTNTTMFSYQIQSPYQRKGDNAAGQEKRVWCLSPFERVNTDCMKIQREQSPKSIAVPPTAHTGGGMWLCGVSIKCLCLYKWRHRGDFSISSYSPRYRLQRGKKGAFFNTFHNNKFWPFKELYIKNWAESSKSLWWRHLY